MIEIVLDQQAYGWSREEIQFQHPHLTLGQIYAALAYYWDQRAELDQDIQRWIERADQIRQPLPELPFVARLKTQGSR